MPSSPANDRDRALQQAFLLRQARRGEEALRVLGPVAGRWNDDAEVAAQLAITLWGLDRTVDAFQQAQRSIALKPNADALRVLSLSAGRLGQIALSWNAALEAVRLDPQRWPNHQAVAIAASRRWPSTLPRRRLPKPNPAVQAAENALALAPESAHCHALLADMVLLYSKGDLLLEERAQREVDAALAIDPELVLARRLQADLHQRYGQKGHEVAVLARTLADAPGNAAVERELVASLSLPPGYRQAYFTLIAVVVGFGGVVGSAPLGFGEFAAVAFLVALLLIGMQYGPGLRGRGRAVRATLRRHPKILLSWAPVWLFLLDALFLLPYGLWRHGR